MKVDLRYDHPSESINHVLFSCPIARRVWAYFDYLLTVASRKDVPEVISRIFPWVWLLCKNKNAISFEGKVFTVEDTVNKIKEDARHWFEIHEVDGSSLEERRNRIMNGNLWHAPQSGRFKCNVGIAWSKGKSMGTSWIIRDSRGEVLVWFAQLRAWHHIKWRM